MSDTPERVLITSGAALWLEYCEQKATIDRLRADLAALKAELAERDAEVKRYRDSLTAILGWRESSLPEGNRAQRAIEHMEHLAHAALAAAKEEWK